MAATSVAVITFRWDGRMPRVSGAAVGPGGPFHARPGGRGEGESPGGTSWQ